MSLVRRSQCCNHKDMRFKALFSASVLSQQGTVRSHLGGSVPFVVCRDVAVLHVQSILIITIELKPSSELRGLH